MITRNKILAGVAAIAFGVWYKVRSAYDRLKFRIAGFRLNGMSSDTDISVDLTIQMYNPTSIQLKVGQLDAGIYLQGVQIGSVKYNYDFYIEGNQVNEITFNTVINASQFTATAWNLLKSSQIQSWYISLKGTVNIADRKIKVAYNYPLKNLI